MTELSDLFDERDDANAREAATEFLLVIVDVLSEVCSPRNDNGSLAMHERYENGADTCVRDDDAGLLHELDKAVERDILETCRAGGPNFRGPCWTTVTSSSCSRSTSLSKRSNAGAFVPVVTRIMSARGRSLHTEHLGRSL